MRPKSKSFDLPNFYVQMYCTVKERKEATRDLNTSEKLVLQTNFARLKNTFKLTPKEVKALIYFAFKHDPLKTGDPCSYGNFNVLLQAGPRFKRWRHEQNVLIAEVGMREAILRTIPAHTEVDALLDLEMTSLLEEI